MRFLKSIIDKLVVLGLMFLIGLPVLFFMLRPLDDFTYHLGSPKIRTILPSEEIQHNQFLSITGTLDPANIFVSSSGIVSRKHEFFFQLQGMQAGTFCVARSGPLHERLAKHTSFAGELDLEALSPSTFDPITIKGRVHQGNRTILVEFGTLPDASDSDFSSYRKARGWTDLEWKDQKLIAVDELPGNFGDSNGAIFLFGLGLGFLAILALLGYGVLNSQTAGSKETFSPHK